MKRVLIPVVSLVIGVAVGSSISVLRADPTQPLLSTPTAPVATGAAGGRYTTTFAYNTNNLILTDMSNGETWQAQPDQGNKGKWVPFIGPVAR